MKKLILLICFSSMFVVVYSQDQVNHESKEAKNGIGVFSSVGICELSRPQDNYNVIGAHGNAVFSYGLNYSRTLSKRTKLETGIFYSKYSLVNHIFLKQDLIVDFDFYATEYLKIISIPILVKYYFPKDYFLTGGTILDLGLKRGPGWLISDSQNGFALRVGAGKEISMGRFYLSIATNFDLHAAIPFSGDLSQQKLVVPGFKVGLNYKL
jgi:hypothetical protein